MVIDPSLLNQQKATLLASVEGWSPLRCSFRPAPGCWSAAQMFDHIVKTEERILQAAKEGVSRPHRIGITDRVRTRFLRKVFESDRRVKVPASASVVLPGENSDMDSVLSRWQAVRGDLTSFHSQLTPRQMQQGIFKHPVGGWMTISGVMEFFYVHMLHHAYQLQRLSSESKNL